MPNYCSFRLRASGPREDIEGFAAEWNVMLRETTSGPDANGFTTKILDYRAEYPEVPESDPVPYCDCDYMGCRIENGLVVIDAVTNWRPPLNLICSMSARWPELEFVLCNSVEHELNEAWHFRAGEVAIIDLWFEKFLAHEDEESEAWYVRDGKLLKWPDSHEIQWTGQVHTHQMPDWAFIPESDILMQEAAEGIVGDFESFMLDSAEAVEDNTRTTLKEDAEEPQ